MMKNLNALSNRCLLLGFALFCFCRQSQSQSPSENYIHLKDRKIVPNEPTSSADSVLIYSKRFVEIYFKQADMKAQLKQKRYSKDDNALFALLAAKKKVIEFVDQGYSYTKGESDSIRTARKAAKVADEELANQIIESVGFDLILAGKFSLFSLSEKRFVTKGIKGRRVKGQLGNRWYIVSLPGGQQFYAITMSFGE